IEVEDTVIRYGHWPVITKVILDIDAIKKYIPQDAFLKVDRENTSTLNIPPMIPTIISPIPSAKLRVALLNYCQLRVYLTYSSGLFTRSLIVLASLDRLLLCSLNATTRSLCNVKMAIRIIRILKLFSFILPIHVLISNNLHLPLRICYSDVYWLNIYDIIYQYIFVVILPSGLMSIFSFILIYRLRSQRIRLARELRIRDKQLIWMLLSQVLFYTIFHVPSSIVTSSQD
ncbi:unnamed protein product, partial [Rotaria sp. Silwood1]